MADFSDIYDQEQMKEHMQYVLKTDKASHAYIISGEDGSGKEFIARIFAKALASGMARISTIERSTVAMVMITEMAMFSLYRYSNLYLYCM